MNIKNIFIGAMLTLTVLGGTMYLGNSVLSENNGTISRGSVAVSTDFQNLEDLAAASPIVITAQTKDEGEIFTYSDVEFTKTQINVNDILRDETNLLKKRGNITLLQTYVMEDPSIDKNEKVLLFLEKYEGKVIDELAFVVNGLEQGHFKIKDGEIISKSKEGKVKENTKGKNIDDVKQTLSAITYDENADMAEPMPKGDKQKYIEKVKKAGFTDEQIAETLE
ncbi:hypothetical protein [Schinkia azotoformans]|nr:hypothetical protein [Schinkia azotoformans]MEC1716524.1 hypothetical protein [Schinkia azotoformans]MEC1745644.1 hypothetical protein [Schinkia azotoformans]MEC1760628.1 hypothetical protein [Schinkia azotoformans]MED4378253.1 hypothetical protein [Schinkia azotoformans]